MDRYIVREKKLMEPQGNQIISFTARATSAGNIIPPNVYGNMVQEGQHMQYSPFTIYPTNNQLQQNLSTVESGIDPRYLSSYENHNPATVYGQQMAREDIQGVFTDYQSRVFVGPDRIENKHYQQAPYGLKNTAIRSPQAERSVPVLKIENQPMQMRNVKQNTNVANIKQEVDLSNEEGRQVKTRSEKLKSDTTGRFIYSIIYSREKHGPELHKIGTKVFSGPVVKILKWNRAVQEIGAPVLFEIIGKCVSVRPEHPASKALVVRDESGPAMQVVYHEIDFLLPDLNVPCMVRVIGRMKPGTCRLQAFSVRAATGDDIATLPRRAAVAAHHVAKLCKEYGQN